MDALLGAIALGDIGKFFPDSEEEWHNADSIGMLELVYNLIREQGYYLGNTDITIVLESPRLAPYLERMRARIADTLGTDIGNVSVKATTEEKMGFTGEGIGISATAAVLLVTEHPVYE
jgi:2-C-methyl-D-erythritol 2,4-cyclodiphosphate synthase